MQLSKPDCASTSPSAGKQARRHGLRRCNSGCRHTKTALACMLLTTVVIRDWMLISVLLQKKNKKKKRPAIVCSNADADYVQQLQSCQ